ncbi:tail fiber domain-containing protein [Flavitalea sp. BT771]|uniref:tail fiber domain-containing protein n=1 Tax=Flavitalea sp. BT771 TaxID=3063329 RepID=UPI0026E27655|nr:tail fiber domain-containing protein [Flavitalea sp. BT771]MDO6430038.1 tail fiber domain-containing protein [Flavitalea sp. BT771]MDV6219823.1 tail fiber domain-containing protein [Flavitalea sp. BT771]
MNKTLYLPGAVLAFCMIQSATAQNVGIGTTAPVDKLTVRTNSANYGVSHTDGNIVVGTYVGGGYGWLGTKSPHPLAFYTGGGGAQMTIETNGNVGIGAPGAVNHLQIGSTPSFSGNDLAIGNGVQGMSFFQTAGASTWYSNVNFALMPNGSAGNVGIGTQTPVNNLQIGSVGATGIGGNHIAFGNGVQASGITQTASAAQWYSTTDIVLMPRSNGHGRVGINTASPFFPFEVDDYVDAPSGGFAYFTNDGQGIHKISSPSHISIYAKNDVLADGFEAISDARVKDILGLSDAAKDLETLSRIRVTNYTLKDKVNHGNKPFKKVIAQQVETVYPQVVSTHMDFIPNVYQAASKITKTDKGYLLDFDSAHHISREATKLKVLASDDHTMNNYAILALPSDKEVLIDATQLNGDKVFVYGEQVDDFRTVDYEGLTTLNISATQELGKIVKRQQAAIRAQQKKIVALNVKLEALMEALKGHKPLN